MFRKMIEDALGELLQEMAPARPEIDPPDQRRRPDMSQAPGTDGRRAVGDERLPPSERGQPRPVVVRPAIGGEGNRAPRTPTMGEGHNAPREASYAEGRSAPREQSFPEGNRRARPRTNLRTTIEEGAPMRIERRRPSGIRKNLADPAAIRNAFRVMEILGRPVALRDLPDPDRR